MRHAPGRFRELRALGSLAIVALGIALHEYRGIAEAYRSRDARMRPLLTRLAVTDRLIGARLPALRLVGLDGRERPLHGPGEVGVYWFVQVGACASCLEQQLARWHALAASTALESAVVLVGASVAEARRIARGANIRTATLVDTAAAAAAFGVRAPSVSVVVDGGGVVLLADARYAGSASRCGWSFFEQIRALYGDGESARIRAAANVAP